MISIITAAYNCEAFLEETYKSIRAQTLANWEWIVVDDSSTDGTYRLLQELAARDRRLRVFRNPENLGAADSRNLALDHAGREFVAFVDSDDIWRAEKLAMQVDFMRDGKDFSFTGYEVVTEDGTPSGKVVDAGMGQVSFDYEDMLAKRATLGCSTVMLRRSLIGDLRMPQLRAGQDYAFWLSILRQGSKAFLLPEILTAYRIRKNSLSRNKIRKARQQWAIYRKVEGLKFLRSLYYFFWYAFRAVTR